MSVGTNLMAQVLSLGPTWQKDRADSAKLSSDLCTCAVAHVYPHPHYTKIINH